MHIHALKVEEWAEQVYRSLKDGVGRFGWSYMKDDNGLPLGDADLNRLKSKITSTGWETLTRDEQDRYQPFLLELQDGDYVVYINVPQWGRCRPSNIPSVASSNG
jgi:hypothetical protein